MTCMGGFSFQGSYGRRVRSSASSTPTTLADSSLRFASPVGTTQDDEHNVWIADAGHNRLVVVDEAMDRLLATVGGASTEPGSFNLPLRVAHHPTESAVFVADTGNGRIQRLEYAYDEDGESPRITDASVFAAGDAFHPNGIALYEYWDGLRVIVADEFYHEGEDLRGRVVVFDADGTERQSFQALGEENPTPLYWPQGLDVDDEGRIYVANTGYGVLHDGLGGPAKLATVVRCTRTGEPAPFEGRSDEVLAELPMPRDVAVVGSGRDAQLFVPDAATGRIHVYTSVGIADGVVPESDEDLHAHAALEDGVGLPHDGHDGHGDEWHENRPMQDRFRGPVGIRGVDGRTVEDSDADDPTLPVLVSEGLAQRVGAYAVDIHRESARGLDAVGAPRDGPDEFAVPTGSELVPSDDTGGPLAGSALVADGANGRLQRLALDADLEPAGSASSDSLAPIDLSATRFPFGVAYLPAGAAGGRLFVTDYTERYREEDDGGQVHVYAIRSGDESAGDDTVDCSLVHSFAPWGLGEDEVKLPRGVAVDPLDDQRARVYVTDSFTGRLCVWEYDWVRDAAEPVVDRGGFGHFDGAFWNPSDVAVGERGVYVADENNHRIQRWDGEDWHAVGTPGYGDGHEFLLPISVEAYDGYLFVLDLVTRAIEVFEEDASAPGGLRPVDSMRSFGGDATAGDLWLPYLLSVGDVSPDDGLDVIVPDSTLHAAQRYTWDGAE